MLCLVLSCTAQPAAIFGSISAHCYDERSLLERADCLCLVSEQKTSQIRRCVCVNCTATVYNCARLRQNRFGPNRPLSPLLYCFSSILFAAEQEQLIWSLRGRKAPVLLSSFTVSDFSLFPGAARELNHYASLLCGSTQLSKIWNWTVSLLVSLWYLKL